ncbi:MmcQ/YjbR family DNA-binding protein [Sphingomonas flavalba]|uniref:MmcQ/YjbR family DNA-binding protein n=1 Tax=Sphingomonas flavalba TaxID=2559804 RepID=UPI00109DF5FB|nr:MmcQ/YjbR family DNA-binding protein [Sphingomonas flavalba]
MTLDWNRVVDHALTLPDAERGTSYGAPAVKVAGNGRVFLSPGREDGSFCLHIDRDMVEMLKESDPDTYWQTAHYAGWPAVLVRYATADPGRVLAMIGQARDWNAARPKVRRRGKA